MKIPSNSPQVPPSFSQNNSLALQAPKKAHPQKIDAAPELREAAEGLEAIFAAEMLKAMRKTISHSEYSLHNTASDIYQGMLDGEYAETAAKLNSLGLSEQILDYWLRSQPNPQYNKNRDPLPGNGGTGGTNEGQSDK